ncbi:MAG: MopE-related protein, partial [Nitrospirota bacterium]
MGPDSGPDAGSDLGPDAGDPCAECTEFQICVDDAFCVTIPELCDGLDNNGNGIADEPYLPDLGNACDSAYDDDSCTDGIMVCLFDGTMGCTDDSASVAELCDGVEDEDCDGAVDENCDCVDGETRTCGPASETGECQFGIQTCESGTWGLCESATFPSVELCNGLDDDCNGVVDGVTVETGSPCGTSNLGNCSFGSNICVSGALQCVGNVEPILGSDVCGGGNTDCDGLTDEDSLPEVIYCGLGDCRQSGERRCEAGSFVEICSEGTPGVELCDGVNDEDCDGSVDNGCECLPGISLPCGTDTGQCEAGTQFCETDGRWSECLGEVSASLELCDGVEDEDCDGAVDEN